MVPLSVTTALLAGFLALLVEPLVGKLVLPAYGGAAAVWTTALVFFQAALLCGYGLAHVLIGRLGLSRAAALEVLVVALPVAALPLLALPAADPTVAAPPAGASSAAWLGGLLGLTVGAPFVALTTTTPTLQRWLAASEAQSLRQGAFRLFAAGNLGSFLGLLTYPTLVEPNFDLADQVRLWSVGYLAFAGLVCAGAVAVRRRPPSPLAPSLPCGPGPRDSAAAGIAAPVGRLELDRRVLGWIGLSAVPSALVVGTTAHLSIDVAAVPLLWVVPLAVYVGTFVLAFACSRPIGSSLGNALLPPFALGVVVVLLGAASYPLWLVFMVELGALSCAGLVVHGRLARARPTPERLTLYDLAIAAGGALGGLAALLLAPLVLPVPIEGAIALAFALGLRQPRLTSVEDGQSRAGSSGFRTRLRRAGAVARRLPFAARYLATAATLLVVLRALQVEVAPGVALFGLLLGLLLGLAGRPVVFASAVAALIAGSVVLQPPSLETVRTFYGVRRVVADGDGRHALFAGTTVQGIQRYLPPDRRREPLGYYYRASPIATSSRRPRPGGRRPGSH